jgi:hypothetical protein
MLPYDWLEVWLVYRFPVIMALFCASPGCWWCLLRGCVAVYTDKHGQAAAAVVLLESSSSNTVLLAGCLTLLTKS